MNNQEIFIVVSDKRKWAKQFLTFNLNGSLRGVHNCRERSGMQFPDLSQTDTYQETVGLDANVQEMVNRIGAGKFIFEVCDQDCVEGISFGETPRFVKSDQYFFDSWAGAWMDYKETVTELREDGEDEQYENDHPSNALIICVHLLNDRNHVNCFLTNEAPLYNGDC